MKKVGIMTFHRAHNAGAMLQAFALQQYLSDFCDSVIIDYRNTRIENQDHWLEIISKKIKFMIKTLFFLKKNILYLKKYKAFNHFLNKYLVTTDKRYDKKNIISSIEEIDIFITGSDQVWNPQLTDDDSAYFLDFVPTGKKISYAASFSNKNFFENTDSKQKYTSWLSEFPSFLLREEAGKDILELLKVKNRTKAQVVCDPVFLLSKDQWISKLSLVEDVQDYILLFVVSPQKKSYEFTKKLANINNLKVKYINYYGKDEDCPEWGLNLSSSGPIEFLNLLLNARYVITTSFHAMAFSIIFEKQFFFELDYRPDNRNERLIQLEKIFGLKKQRITSDNCENLNSIIDYASKKEILNQYSAVSKALLRQQIE